MRKGFKSTELGIIPIDWIDAKFDDVMTGFSSGQTPYRAIARYYSGDVPWITSGELNYNVITDTLEKITNEAVVNTNLKILPRGTFLFAITGLEAAGTRGSCAITGIEATTNQSCMALYPKPNSLTTEYLFQFYLKYGDWLALRYCQGTKQQSYTGAIAKKLPIVLPPTTAEQNAIAKVLSDTDALIKSLEKLIEKKRALKEGVMQDLLKPKEGWTLKRLGEIAEIKTGKKNNDDKVDEGEFPFFVRSQTIERINTYSYDGEAILMPGEGNIGSVIHYINGKFDFHQRVYKISNFDTGYSAKYIYFCLHQNFNAHAMMNTVKATVDSLRLPTFQEFEIFFPKTKDGQDYIANVLSCIVDEIGSIEKTLSKYKMIKQGMMQELLTGKTRIL